MSYNAAWALELFGGTGVFVEGGAFDGVSDSACHTLERVHGWTGVCVEANPNHRRALVANREQSLCAALTGESNVRREFIVTQNPGLSGIRENTTRDSFRTAHFGSGYTVESTYCPVTISLCDLLDKFKFPKIVNYLSLDIEGSEHEVLESFFRINRKYTIQAISVEGECTKEFYGHRNPGLRFKYERNSDMPLTKLLLKENYRQVYNGHRPEDRGSEMYFLHPSVVQERAPDSEQTALGAAGAAKAS
jgi:FkbM family methyltransferase